MKTHGNKILIFKSVGFGLLIFTFTFVYSSGLLLYIEKILTVDNTPTAVQSVSTVRTLQAQFASKYQGNFAPNFDELIRLVQLNDKFKGESPFFNGYIYKMTVLETSGRQLPFYSITADPIDDKSSYFKEHRHYYFDSSLNTIKVTEENRQATASDPSI